MRTAVAALLPALAHGCVLWDAIATNQGCVSSRWRRGLYTEAECAAKTWAEEPLEDGTPCSKGFFVRVADAILATRRDNCMCVNAQLGCKLNQGIWAGFDQHTVFKTKACPPPTVSPTTAAPSECNSWCTNGKHAKVAKIQKCEWSSCRACAECVAWRCACKDSWSPLPGTCVPPPQQAQKAEQQAQQLPEKKGRRAAGLEVFHGCGMREPCDGAPRPWCQINGQCHDSAGLNWDWCAPPPLPQKAVQKAQEPQKAEQKPAQKAEQKAEEPQQQKAETPFVDTRCPGWCKVDLWNNCGFEKCWTGCALACGAGQCPASECSGPMMCAKDVCKANCGLACTPKAVQQAVQQAEKAQQESGK